MTYVAQRQDKPARTRNPRPAYGHMTPHDHWLIRELAAGGMDYAEIASKFECTRTYVGRVVRFEVAA